MITAAPFSRRSLLLGTAGLVGAAAVASACGGGGTGSADGFVVVQRFPNTSLTPGHVRLPVSIASTNGSLRADGPTRLSGSIVDSTGATRTTVDAGRFGAGHAVPYWSVEADLGEPGIYSLVIDGASGDPTPFQLFDPTDVTIPTVGAVLPGFDTPTTRDPRGVDPVCTRLDGPCPFHEHTLTEALAAGTPVAYLVGTPAHCSTGTCAPGLEALIAVAATYGDAINVVHAEVYADPAGTEVAPAVTALTLDYEPVVWLTTGDGQIATRVDIVWDEAELTTLVARAIGSPH